MRLQIIPAYNERTKSNKWVIGKEIRLHTGSSICLQGCHLIQAEEGYECDDNRQEKMCNNDYFPKDLEREICAVYFKEAVGTNILIENITAGENLTSVFGSTGENNVKIYAKNIIRRDEDIPVLKGNGIFLE